MSHFQRLSIITSLNKMAHHYPKVARPLFYRIYQNNGEATELRVAAVFQIMKTNPPAQMLQRMAEFTNYDEDTQVISAVQSAIRTAAFNLQDPEDHELQMNAQSAVNMLNPKEMSLQYSKKYLRSYNADKLNLAYRQSYSHIGSDDGFVPNNMFYNVHESLGGFQRQPFGFGAMSSSWNDLSDLFMDQTNTKYNQYEEGTDDDDSQTGITYRMIKNMLKIQSNEQKQVEASFLLNTLAGQRFFAINNHTIEQLSSYVKKYAKDLHNGRSFDFTKFYHKDSIVLAFPTAMGLPYVYRFETPTLLHFNGDVKANTDQPSLANGGYKAIPVPKVINATVKITYVYSSRIQSSMGFVTPFNKGQHISGLNRNIQVNLPFTTDINIDTKNNQVSFKVAPRDHSNKQNVFEYSTKPYTAKQELDWLVKCPQYVLQEGYNRSTIHVRKANQIHKTFGQDSTGMAFEFNYNSEQKFIDFAKLFNSAHKHDFISSVIYAWTEDSINANNITVTYNPQKSSAKSALFTTTYYENNFGNMDNDNQNYNYDSNNEISAKTAQLSSSYSNAFKRVKELSNRAGQGLRDGNKVALDWSAEFHGDSKAHYFATFATARSYVNDTSRVLFYAQRNPYNSNNVKPVQVSFAAEIDQPRVPLMDFQQALKASPTSKLNAELAYGELSNSQSDKQYKIQFKGYMEQTDAMRRYVEQSPMAKQCKNQMAKGNNVQYACRNVTSMANALDHLKFSASYEQVSDYWKNATYKAYAVLRQLGYYHNQEDFTSANNPDHKIQLEVQFAPDFKAANISIDTPIISSEFQNVHLNKYASAFFGMHPEYSCPLKRTAQRAFLGQQYPTCVVDGNLAQTFDNKTYPIDLGECWHVMFHYSPQDYYPTDNGRNSHSHEKISVLVRDLPTKSTNKKREILVVIGDYRVHMDPENNKNDRYDSTDNNFSNDFDPESNIDQGTNFNQIVDVFDYKMTYYKGPAPKTGAFYSPSQGEVRMFFPEQDLEIQYDGSSIKLKAPNKFRSEARGLCGTFNTQPADDFTIPQGYILQNPYEFAASYALTGESSCKGPANQYKEAAQQSVASGQFTDNDVIYGNYVDSSYYSGASKGYLRSSAKYISPLKKKSMESNQFKSPEKSSAYKKYSTLVMSKDGMDCFSLAPVLQCDETSQATEVEIQQVPFSCLEPSKTTQHYKQMIRSGAKPDFSQKGERKSYKVNVPKNCSQ